MQFFGNGSREDVKNHNKPGNKVKTGIYLAFVTSIIVILVVVIYAFTAYPNNIFSAETKATYIPAVLIDSHPVLPPSPLKTSSEKMVAGMDDTWARLFKSIGKNYVKPKLQLFTDTIIAESCGYGQAVTGSFYCPAGRIVYLDLSVLQGFEKTHPSLAKLAQAYVIGHQTGHHVLNLLAADTVNARQADKLDLQADYYAGVWAHYAWKNQKPVDDIDLELAISLVTQVGLDRMAKPGANVPDAYSHITASERAKWFSSGYRSGDLKHPAVFAGAQVQ